MDAKNFPVSLCAPSWRIKINLFAAMRCFSHQDKEAVGICKSCGKGVCSECAIDLGKGLACRGRCEESARAVIQFVDRNIELSTKAAQAQFVVPSVVQRTGQPADFIATQLASHIRETLNLRWMLAVFSAGVGVILLVGGVTKQLAVLDFVGACGIAFGLICFFQAQRNAARPKLPETHTR